MSSNPDKSGSKELGKVGFESVMAFTVRITLSSRLNGFSPVSASQRTMPKLNGRVRPPYNRGVLGLHVYKHRGHRGTQCWSRRVVQKSGAQTALSTTLSK